MTRYSVIYIEKGEASMHAGSCGEADGVWCVGLDFSHLSFLSTTDVLRLPSFENASEHNLLVPVSVSMIPILLLLLSSNLGSSGLVRRFL